MKKIAGIALALLPLASGFFVNNLSPRAFVGIVQVSVEERGRRQRRSGFISGRLSQSEKKSTMK